MGANEGTSPQEESRKGASAEMSQGAEATFSFLFSPFGFFSTSWELGWGVMQGGGQGLGAEGSSTPSWASVSLAVGEGSRLCDSKAPSQSLLQRPHPHAPNSLFTLQNLQLAPPHAQPHWGGCQRSPGSPPVLGWGPQNQIRPKEAPGLGVLRRRCPGGPGLGAWRVGQVWQACWVAWSQAGGQVWRVKDLACGVTAGLCWA